MTPSHELRRAAEAVARALTMLDTSEHTCPACGCRVLENLQEGRIAEQLGPLPEKLRTAAHRIDRNAATSRHEDTL